MIKEQWKNCTTAAEIIDLLKNDESLNKFKVLMHYVSLVKIDIVSDLLKSGLYTPEEIALKHVSVYSRLTYPQLRNVLLEFANKAWMDLDDPKEILNMRVGLVNKKYEDMIMKLDYFEERNPDLYKQMLYIIKDTYSLTDLRELVIHFTKRSERVYKYKDFMIDLLKERSSLLSCVSSVVFPDIVRASEKKNIEDAVFDVWQNLKNEELIMYQATEANKWEILEYFAEKDSEVFRRLVDRYTCQKLHPGHKDNVRYLRDQVIARYEKIGLDKVPSVIKDYVLELKQSIIDQQKKSEDRKNAIMEERKKKNLSWVDDDGVPIVFFMVKDFFLNGRKDYIKVVDKYLDCDLSVDAFCRKYMISDKDGFNKVLDKISLEDEEYSRKIEEKAKNKQNKYRALLKKLIYSICVEDESVKSLINYSKLIDYKKIVYLANSFYPNRGYDKVLSKKIIDYYYERVNSYDNSYDLDNINKMLNRDEIRFLVGNDKFDSMMRGEKGSVEKGIIDLLNNLNAEDKKVYGEKVYGSSERKISRALAKYNSKFILKNYSWDEVFMTNENGEQIKVTKEMIQTAQIYAVKKGLYTSESVVKRIIKSIVNGKFDVSIDLALEKEKVKNNVSELVKNVTSLDEFLMIIDGSIKR